FSVRDTITGSPADGVTIGPYGVSSQNGECPGSLTKGSAFASPPNLVTWSVTLKPQQTCEVVLTVTARWGTSGFHAITTGWQVSERPVGAGSLTAYPATGPLEAEAQ